MCHYVNNVILCDADTCACVCVRCVIHECPLTHLRIVQIVEMLLQHGDARQARRKNRQYRLSTGLRGVTPLQLAASQGSVSLLNELMHSRETFAGLSWDQVRRKYSTQSAHNSCTHAHSL